MSFEIERRVLPGASAPEKPLQRWRRLWRWLPLVLLAAAFWFGRGAFRGSPSETVLELGRETFEHVWTENDPLADDGDGLGPVFNERSCVACHFQGGVGGGGTNEFNVTSFEVVATETRPTRASGVIHADAVRPEDKETFADLRREYPVENGNFSTALDPLRVAEINSPPLFGLGLVEDISDWTIRQNAMSRSFGRIGKEFRGDFEGTPSGRALEVRGGVGKFGWKSQFASLDEFVATACAVELGLSNPVRRQDEPHAHAEDTDAAYDIDHRRLRALVAFVRSLPRPEQILPTSPNERAIVEQGERIFASVGCADCHTPDLGGVEGLYSDLLLHSLIDPDESVPPYYGPVPLPPPPYVAELKEWKTPPLWGVADSAPYMHDGSAATLEAAVQQHGGNARHVRARFNNLSQDDRQRVFAFLKTLRAPQSALPVVKPQLAAR